LGLPAGDYEVQETEHAGYGEPSIYCWQQGVELAFPVVAIDGRIEGTIDPALFPLEESLNYTCSWINFEDDGANTVTVKKSNCPLGPPYEELEIGLIEVCTDFQAGVEFTISWEGFTDTQATAANGEVYWAGVPEGPIAIQETIPDGYGDPYVYCRYVPDDPAAPSLWFAFGMVVDGLVEWAMDAPPVDFECEWLNIPDDSEESTVAVYKRICPEGAVFEPVMEGGEVLITDYIDTCTEPGAGIEFTLDNADGSSTRAIGDDVIVWEDVPQGPFTLTETMPPGFGEAVWHCNVNHYEGGVLVNGIGEYVDAPGGVHSDSIDHPEGAIYWCWVFNMPGDDDRTVTVHKWHCPEELLPESEDFEDWANTCTEPLQDVEFTLTDEAANVTQPTGLAGWTTFDDTAQGDVSLMEHTPPGYFDPIVFCSLEAAFEDGAAYAEGMSPYAVTDSIVSKELYYAEYAWVCHFFNIEKGPGEITVNKWTCPPGYDLDAWDADPIVDCVEATDGIEFTLKQPVLPDVMQSTGNAIPGAVHFGDLEAGAYVVTETVPDGIDYVFVWDCVGTDIAAVHPTPLNLGNILNIDVAAGDSIVCNWYNVPDPEHGWLTVQKYSCWTETYISDIDCETFEFGASFELFDSADTSLGVGMTDAGGTWTWVDLDDGVYRIEEISHEPCHVSISNDDGDGNAVVVAGEETVVSVYNCAIDTGGKIPHKYPNTGAGPIGGAMTSLQGSPEPDATPTSQTAAEAFYEISCLDDPDESETSTAAGEEDCERGSIPERLTIDAAGVNHDVEVLEIVDGVMQAPTGPNVVSWYKETARLGESNNLIIAGHLNWWNVPEGPFFHLNTLEEGDRIELTGEDDTIYVYEVQWVQQESNLEAPVPEVVGPTDKPSLTLITCGGEWDTSISEYNERTVVRAVQVDVIAADDGTEDADQAAMPLAA
jgi:sortase (surface protein transpeptidase)